MTVSVGHCHPDVVSAVNAQNQLLQHTTTIYLNNQIAEYAKELADRMPGDLKARPHARMELHRGIAACHACMHACTHAHGRAQGPQDRRRPAAASSTTPMCTPGLPCCATQVVYFVNSGSEANDMAMMLARAYTGACVAGDGRQQAAAGGGSRARAASAIACSARRQRLHFAPCLPATGPQQHPLGKLQESPAVHVPYCMPPFRKATTT